MPEDHKDPVRQADEIEKLTREIEARELARRGLAYEEPLMVKLPSELKERLKVEAARSRSDMSKIVRDLITDYVKRMEDERRKEEGRGRLLVEHMTGRATSGMTTDEIMALTRGEA
jgi:predicted DNA-binding protein